MYTKGKKRRREVYANDFFLNKRLINKEEKPLTEDEKEEYIKLVKIKESLELELSTYESNSEFQHSMKEIMELLHEYNNIKDATQIVLGSLATMRGITVASLHQEFDLPLKDE